MLSLQLYKCQTLWVYFCVIVSLCLKLNQVCKACTSLSDYWEKNEEDGEGGSSSLLSSKGDFRSPPPPLSELIC